MKMIIFLTLLLIPICSMSAGENDIGLTAHDIFDNRISLGLSTKVKHRQLVNMRAQMKAAQTIIGLLAEEKFERASKISHAKFGFTDEMNQIYDLSKNEDFKKLGIAFHNSATELDTALQTKDMRMSLRALHNTMGYCVSCHRKFRQ